MGYACLFNRFPVLMQRKNAPDGIWFHPGQDYYVNLLNILCQVFFWKA